MNKNNFHKIIQTISKGDTSFAESFFEKPGGKKYLENIVLILVNTLPHIQDDKEEIYSGFVQILNRIEKRIQRQKEGTRILKQIIE
jgi:hypothetical protein